MIHLPGTGEQQGTGAMLHWVSSRLVAYVAVLVAVGLLVLAGASVFALMWPRGRWCPSGKWVIRNF